MLQRLGWMLVLGMTAWIAAPPVCGQDTFATATKIRCTRTSDTTAVITFSVPADALIEYRHKGPTGTFGVWDKVQDDYKVEVNRGIVRINVDKLRHDLAYRFEFRLRLPKKLTDPLGVFCPLPTLELVDGAIDFKKLKGPYRIAVIPGAKKPAERSMLELEWPKNSAKKELSVGLEIYPVSATGKLFRDMRGDVFRVKQRATFSPEKNTWTWELDALLKLLRKTQKTEDLKQSKLLITVAPLEPEKTDPLEMCRFISDLKGRCLLVDVDLDFEAEALAVLHVVSIRGTND